VIPKRICLVIEEVGRQVTDVLCKCEEALLW